MPPPAKTSRSPKTGASGTAGNRESEKQVLVNLTVPPAQYPVLFFANKIGIEFIAGETLVHFGTVSESMGALAQFAVVLDREMIRTNSENWATFQARNPPLTNANIDFSFRCSPAALKSVPFASWAAWASDGDRGELRLFSLSMGEMLDARRENKFSLTAQPIALIRTSADLQGHLLTNLLLKTHEHD